MRADYAERVVDATLRSTMNLGLLFEHSGRVPQTSRTTIPLEGAPADAHRVLTLPKHRRKARRKH